MISEIICKLIFVIAIFYILFITFPIIQVSGDSMHPTLKDKQFLLGCIFFRLKVGRIYVYKSPVDGKIVIKRLLHIKDNECFFVGDNKRVSVDSRKYGFVPKQNIIAIVIGGKKKDEFIFHSLFK